MIEIFLFLAGITMGSFFHLVGERLPVKRSILFPRSHCTVCKQPLSLHEMIPLVSYVVWMGSCKHCGTRLSWLYPTVELLTGGLFLFVYRIAGFSFEGLFLVILCSLFVIAVVSDLLYMRVPNELFLFFFPLFVIYRTLEPLLIWWEGAASLIFCILLFSSLDYFKPNSMGGADMKLFSLLAFCFGFKPFLLMLFLSCIAGMVYAKVFSFQLDEPFPFVPAIAFSFWLYLFGAPVLFLFG
ncbi:MULTISPECIES: prepilin peptidase [Bacillus]|uniref:prepilin peptidase n=1 Tax=Bacillus TaxID=1386 RepID=UPI000D02C5E1|nr:MULTISPECIES: A24 family peptidase [Bacillus]MCK6164374.1 prepilin peptidase [Bacillus pumilus]MCK6184880.1 prepilin peptidase [Bacillus pumilus]PRS49225.1 prepilin peptidase [Bacillus sp. LNXM10]PRS51679.1 prepilin peptidase [Bacillus sp. MZGC1]